MTPKAAPSKSEESGLAMLSRTSAEPPAVEDEPPVVNEASSNVKNVDDVNGEALHSGIDVLMGYFDWGIISILLFNCGTVLYMATAVMSFYCCVRASEVLNVMSAMVYVLNSAIDTMSYFIFQRLDWCRHVERCEAKAVLIGFFTSILFDVDFWAIILYLLGSLVFLVSSIQYLLSEDYLESANFLNYLGCCIFVIDSIFYLGSWVNTRFGMTPTANGGKFLGRDCDYLLYADSLFFLGSILYLWAAWLISFKQSWGSYYLSLKVNLAASTVFLVDGVLYFMDTYYSRSTDKALYVDVGDNEMKELSAK